MYHVNTLIDLAGKWVDRVQERKPIGKLILDLDSSVSETSGAQEGRPTTGTLAVPATIPGSVFTSSAILSEHCCARATAPMIGIVCLSQSWLVIARRISAAASMVRLCWPTPTSTFPPRGKLPVCNSFIR